MGLNLRGPNVQHERENVNPDRLESTTVATQHDFDRDKNS